MRLTDGLHNELARMRGNYINSSEGSEFSIYRALFAPVQGGAVQH